MRLRRIATATVAVILLLSLLPGCKRQPATPTAQPRTTSLAAASPTRPAATPTLPEATATVPEATASATPEPAAEPSPTSTRPPATPTVPPATRPPATAQPSATPTAPAEVQPAVTSLVVTPDEAPVLCAVIEGRLYRSADRGATWSEEPRTGLPPEAELNGVAIDYRHPQTMYALTSAGIYRRQGTEPWGLINTLRAKALAVDLTDPQVLWAGIYRTTELNAVIVKSEDGGRTWGKADWGIEWGGWTTDILVDPTNPNILWAVVRTAGRHGWPPGDLYRGGRDGHWEKLSLGPFTPAYDNVQSCFVSGIAYDPNANLLFAGCDLSYFNQGTLRLLRSPNADAPDSSTVRWEVATEFPKESVDVYGAVRPLAVDAREPKSLFASTTLEGFGMPRRYTILVSHDHGATWQTLGVAP